MKKLLYLLFFLALSSSLFAQERVRLSGKVVCKNSKECLLMTPVQIKELGIYSVTDLEGNFVFDQVPKGSYTFIITCLGFQTSEQKITVEKSMSDMVLLMEPQSLSLEKVEVVAKRGSGMTSSSVVNTQALEHIQPSSITDVLQLLPGSLTTNSNMTTANLLTIRSMGASDKTNALGTSLIMDGATVSNDGNMQMKKNGETQSGSTAGTGVDTRQISTDNIESIEIIRGIPSAEYGNMTSGAVVVRTKAGQSPLEVRFKTDPKLKQVYAGKGMKLGAKGGILNVGLDYSNALKNLISPVDAYNRGNLQLSYSTNLSKNLSFNAKVFGNYSVASSKNDPDNKFDEYSREENKTLRVNINGMWKIRRPWLCFIDYMVSANVAEQNDFYRVLESGTRTPLANSMESGIFQGIYTPSSYHSELSIDGLPINLQGKLTGKIFSKWGKVDNKFLLGVEFSSDGNKGKGKTFDPLLPPGRSTYRERSFSDVPFLNRITAFAEDKVTLPLGSTFLDLQAGVRFSAVLPNDKFSMEQLTALEPRLNARYVIFDKNEGFKHLSFRAGWGINYKMPTMAYLYPEVAYLDRILFSYNDFSANNYGFNLFETLRFDERSSVDLKMPKSVNFEVGTDFTIGGISGSVVYFNEKLSNAYEFRDQFQTFYSKRWFSENGTEINFGSGAQFQYSNGNLYRVDGGRNELVSALNDSAFVKYSTATNGGIQSKWGIEYTLDFGTIKALKTQINVDGAYFNISRSNSEMMGKIVGTESDKRQYYVGFYGGNSLGLGNITVNDRFNTNIRLITHLPKLGIVTTFTAQFVLYEGTQNRYSFDGENRAYYFDAAGVRHSGDEVYNNSEFTKNVNPLYIMDLKGNVIPFTQDMELDPRYEKLILRSTSKTYFDKNVFSPYTMFNIRVTKDIKQWASISFYANNFLNLEGRSRNSVTKSYQNKNSGIYFGAEVKFKF